MAEGDSKHVVRQGDTLASIAAEHGFADANVIWDAAQNAELRRVRANPHVLMPGDEVFIPTKRTRTFQAATGQRHTVVVKAPLLKLKVRLLDVFGLPRASKKYVAKVGERREEGTTDGKGNVELKISAGDRRAEIEVETTTYLLSIGELDPTRSRSGLAARLHNLGYGASFDELASGGEHARFALRLFADEKNFDGAAAGSAGVGAKLEEEHGS